MRYFFTFRCPATGSSISVVDDAGYYRWLDGDCLVHFNSWLVKDDRDILE